MKRTTAYLGALALATMLPLVLIPLDAVGAMLRRDLRAPVVRRLALVALTLGTLVPMLWLLAGAPWTSLEWTRGMALRYAQPWWALVPLTAFVGLFPASLPWYRRAWLVLVGGGALAAWGVVLLQRSADLPFPPAPTLTTALVAAAVWAARAALPRRVRVRSVVGGVLAVSILGIRELWLNMRRAPALPEPPPARIVSVTQPIRTEFGPEKTDAN